MFASSAESGDELGGSSLVKLSVLIFIKGEIVGIDKN